MRAREIAEAGARAALRTLAVESESAPAGMSADDRRLRNALRARARVLATPSDPSGRNALAEEIAYEQWHRMLFARFLAENGLLIHPEGASVSIGEVRELAREQGEDDPWVLAASYAAAMLPGIFRADDPANQVRLAPDDRLRLEAVLTTLAAVVFSADDALGWVYQFWQSKRKDEINRSGRKITGRDLAPVTQLFTEHYMVRFLLENTLGAWWASRHPQSPLARELEYLRRRHDGTPAAGTFPNWPARARDVTVMDPCAGSGHFLVAAAGMLRSMRIEEEGLSAGEAAEAVLRENLFGLELDPRCTQLAAFALVFDGWRAELDPKTIIFPNVACSGVAVGGQLSEWKRLAGEDPDLRHALERLYQMFERASDLGSLIDPTAVTPRDELFSPRYEDVAPMLQRALRRAGDDPVAAVFGAAAEGAERAGKLLAGHYTLVATNPPYLARRKQGDALKEFADAAHREGKADLATMFIERCRAFTSNGGAYAMVTPHNWLFLGSYTRLRTRLLQEQSFGHVSRLGAGAFDTISGEIVNVALVVIEQSRPQAGHTFTGLDASSSRTSAEKARLLHQGPLAVVSQAGQLRNPDARIGIESESSGELLQHYADGLQGIATADYARFGRRFWELPSLTGGWERQQSTVDETTEFGGKQFALLWENGVGQLAASSQAVIRGLQAFGRWGVAVAQMGQLPSTIHVGTLFDNNTGVILPKNPAHLPAIWAFCSSSEYNAAIRRFDQSLKVTNATLVKVPFDLAQWQKVADERYPDGLPEPCSKDPTQWLFDGTVMGSKAPLQVAVARLLGYRWPAQKPEALDELADDDGILCLPPVIGESAGAERLRQFLARAYERDWSASRLDDLLGDSGSTTSLEQWLRDDFFAQHIRLFGSRPFIWNVWDGRQDGFSALLNYHRLTRQALEKLTYSHLGWWIERQRAGMSAKDTGAEPRYLAAVALQKRLADIIEGEPPYDIYVRWKPLERQPIGWDPDLDDGVRLNIRPFVEADVLRSKFSINWNKDRGRNSDGSGRINDRHLTRDEKLKARARGATRGPK